MQHEAIKKLRNSAKEFCIKEEGATIKRQHIKVVDLGKKQKKNNRK